MNIQRRLGRGLEALLGQSFPAPNADGSAAIQEHVPHQPSDDAGSGLAEINVYEIDSNPYQPRQEFAEAEIDALAQSIHDHGLIQPIVVRRVGERFQLVAGERRLRAAIKAGRMKIPAQIRDADDRQMSELAIVENLQRKDLNALEKAASFQRYLATYGCTQDELAARLALDRSTIANLIRLLELPGEVQQSLRTGEITAGHARALLAVGNESGQIELCKRIQKEHLSVRAVEQMVQEVSTGDAPALSVIDEDGNSHPVERSADNLAVLEQELRNALGTKVQLTQSAKGRGKITIHFASHEEFDRVRGHLMHSSIPNSQTG
jgi:ParB family transcriptional regulator, chromosome partitioning protein